VHGLNSSYGHKAILASYLEETHEHPIWGFMQHGWTPFDGWTARKRLPERWPRFVWSAQAAGRRPAERSPGTYVTIGSPFAYLLTHLDTNVRPTPGDGCIAFPVHSSEHAAVRGSHASYAEQLRERERGPIDVCLYWLDLRDATIREAYQRCGHRVVSVGTPRSDRYYLLRWLRLLEGKGRAVSNRISTPVVYAASLGLDAGIYGEAMQVVGDAESVDEDVDHGLALLPAAVDEVTPVPTGWARGELGFDHLLRPADLAEALGWRGWRRQAGPLAVAGINLVRGVRGGAVYRDA
jgi:hypothetical protein